VKESLYVLNIDNYSQSLDNFKNNFMKCEKKTISQLLSSDSLKVLLNNLDIKPEEITEEDDIEFGYKNSIKKDNNENNYEPEARHPFEFYLNCNKDILQKLYNYLKENS